MNPTTERPPAGARLRRRLLAAGLAVAGLATVAGVGGTTADASTPHEGTSRCPASTRTP